MQSHSLTLVAIVLTVAPALAQPIENDIRIFRFENVKSEMAYREMVTIIRQVVGVTPELPVDPASGAVTVSASPEKLAIVDFIVNELDGNKTEAGSSLKPHQFTTVDGNIVDIFYLDPTTTPRGIQDTITTLRQLYELNKIYFYSDKKAILFLDSPNQAKAAEWLIPRIAKQDQSSSGEEYKYPGKTDDITRVYHWNPSLSPQDVQRLVHEIRVQGEVQRIFDCFDTRAIAVRATAAKLAIAEELVSRPAPSN